jgi:hypothetical protein
LFIGVPMGYVLLPTGEVVFDPDEQVRQIVHLIFDKFQELGTVYGVFQWLIRNDIRLPRRIPRGAKKGQLHWCRPVYGTLTQMVAHPIYAGVYTYGRRPADPQRQLSTSSTYRPCVPIEQCKVLLKDRVPAYITWDRYLQNREQVKQNQNRPGCRGVPRSGSALVLGILVCGNCGRRMHAPYHADGKANYRCTGQYRHHVPGSEPRCHGLAAKVLDDLVSQQVLRALEPAALELSIQAQADVESERRRLQKQWQHRRQRAQYDTELAERRYEAVDPENRLVAATLEKRWEELLNQARTIDEEYDRFMQQAPVPLSKAEGTRLAALTSAIPALWNSSATANADRKQIIRCLVERVTVHVRYHSELVDVTIRWAGGYESQHQIVRPVATYEQLENFEGLRRRVAELHAAGHGAVHIAERLNAEGFYPPRRCSAFSWPLVQRLLKRQGLTGNGRSRDELLGQHEWWLPDLARQLKMSHLKLRDWANQGWVHSRRTSVKRYWIVWADKDEVCRLRNLLAQSRRGINTYTSALKTPKKRSGARKALVS